MSEITQAQVDEAFIDIKNRWNEKVLESGQTEKMFIALDRLDEASNFLAMYQQTKEEIEKMGLTMPVLVEGLTIRFEEV